MKLVLAVPDPPPLRANSGRCADRESPHAAALARAGDALVRSDPGVFPIDRPFGLTLVLGRAVPPIPEGYGPDDPIIEVLVDVGVIADERLEQWFREDRNPDADSYIVTIESGEGD